MPDTEWPAGDDGESIANAHGLFDEAAPSPGSAAPRSIAPDGEAYDLGEAAESSTSRRHSLQAADYSPGVPIAGGKAPRRDSTRSESPETVTEVWSRFAEWRGTLAGLATEAVVVVLVAYLFFSVEEWGLGFLVLMIGGLGFVVLSYPILITLERPVRITPEQAVRDYYGALSHHRPHLKRMWLLLSDRGKYGGSFATFDGFRRYWNDRLRELQQGRSSVVAPLRFVVSDFKSEKSAGRTEITANYTVDVSVRGRQAEGPVHRFEITSGFVKGPDGMWYLDRATLP